MHMLVKSYSDQKLIEQVIFGCKMFVENMEKQWYKPKIIHPKISQKQLVQLSTLFPSLTEPKSSSSFRPSPTVQSNLSNAGVQKVDKNLTYRSLNIPLNVNYYEKVNVDESSDYSGVNVQYRETKIVSDLKELISRSDIRKIIYGKLLESGTLERYLTICKHCNLLMRKHVNVENAIEGVRATRTVLQQDIEDYKEGYLADQEKLKDMSNRQIFLYAQVLAKKELQNKPLNDNTYTRFFVTGGITFRQVELGFI